MLSTFFQLLKQKLKEKILVIFISIPELLPPPQKKEGGGKSASKKGGHLRPREQHAFKNKQKKH